MQKRLYDQQVNPSLASCKLCVHSCHTLIAFHLVYTGVVVAKERPDLEEQRNELVVQSADNKRKLKEIEDKILEAGVNFLLLAHNSTSATHPALLPLLGDKSVKLLTAVMTLVATCQCFLPMFVIQSHVVCAQILSASEGNILEDESAISVITEAKTLGNEISLKQKVAEETEVQIEAARTAYKPCGDYTAILFFCISGTS